MRHSMIWSDLICYIVSSYESLRRHCIVQMREEPESGIRKREEMRFKTTAEDGEKEAAVTCDGRLFHRRAAATGNTLSPTVDRWVQRRWWGRAYSRRLASVSASQRSSSYYRQASGSSRLAYRFGPKADGRLELFSFPFVNEWILAMALPWWQL